MADGYKVYLSASRKSGFKLAGCRVDGDVATPAPHRPGRAQFTHPVPQFMGLLNLVKYTDERSWGLGSGVGLETA